MAGFEPWSRERGSEIITRESRREGATLPILHALQETFGYIHAGAVPMIAETLNLTRAEVHGVVSFYHDFRHEPPGRHVLRLCRAEACQSLGADALAAHVRRRLGVDWHDTTPDGAVTLEPVFCLGLCAIGPSAMLDGAPLGRLDNARIDSALERAPVTVRVYVPRDAVALALGADAVASLLAQAGDVEVVRTGSRGLFWLEPMVEVETGEGRIAYGPVTVRDIGGLLEAGMLTGGPHPLRLGKPEEIPYLARQTRLTFARCGIVDPLSMDDYRAHGGMRGIARAREIGAAATIDLLTQSGLRGRGGAGFPTGIKWKTAADAKGERKFIVCNADEGDSGTFADRMLMEGDPLVLIEGMVIAGFAVGAAKGYVYTRSEYPHAIATFNAALDVARRDRLLGAHFDIEQRVGGGAYVCGEETSLLDSLEGKRGQVRAKPPLPAHKGLFSAPTVINNVVSLASVPIILERGAEFYRDIGFGRSRGTMPIQLAGNIRYGGLFECGFGVTLGELVNDIGGGTLTGRPVRAVQVGGPLGAYFPPALFETPFDYEAFAAKDGLIGHGGVVVFDDTVDMANQARFAMEFCAVESCGKCTPCRIGSVRGMEVIDRIIAGEQPAVNLELLRDLCHTMKFGSLCALGGFIPYPVMSALEHFPEDFLPRPAHRAAAE